jgi:hypothetical protein
VANHGHRKAVAQADSDDDATFIDNDKIDEWLDNWGTGHEAAAVKLRWLALAAADLAAVRSYIARSNPSAAPPRCRTDPPGSRYFG